MQIRPKLVAAVACLTLAPAPVALTVFETNRAELHEDILEHFKYGSIGAEERAGFPFEIWAVLPKVFPEHLPSRPGNGYERFGFIFEPGKRRPIGTSIRDKRVPFIGLNCAVCHTGTVRDSGSPARRIVLGMPAHQMDLQSYQRFLFACFRDKRFTGDVIWAAMKQENPKLTFFDGIIYKWFAIPRTRTEGTRIAGEADWTLSRPRLGPGRVDTFNPYKVFVGLSMKSDQSIGTADLPSLWNQQLRQGMFLHWDGNNSEVTERNKSAAIGAGCSEDSLDLPSMKRVDDWIQTLRPPHFPEERIDRRRAAERKTIYEKNCAACHDRGGRNTGQVVALSDVGTDPERVTSFTADLSAKMNTLGQGRPWKFTHFHKTNGYAAMPLDGVWLRAPYLHNGSVPSLRDLLSPPEQRPTAFYRGYDVFDYFECRLRLVRRRSRADRIFVRYHGSRQQQPGPMGHNWPRLRKRICSSTSKRSEIRRQQAGTPYVSAAQPASS